MYQAELFEGDPYEISSDQTEAVRVVDADFQWEETQADEGAVGGKGKKGGKGKEKAKEKPKPAVTEIKTETNVQPFTLRNINMTVPRGSIVAIAGRVG